jgi:Fe-S cluster assembly ATP-binding protein
MKIENLTVAKSNKTILNGLNAYFEPGKIHAIMGPNGSGKTTLSYTIAGHPDCEIVEGNILYKEQSLKELEVHERSLLGVHLCPQYPSVIEGLSHAAFLKEAINVRRHHQNLEPLDEFEFLKLLKQKAQEFKFEPKEYIRHSLNSGYSGGEKKRNEILQISMLNPKFIILDEIDSGLDIEAMKYIGEFINNYLKPDVTMLVITHYPEFARLLNAEKVHIIKGGRIVRTEGIDIVKNIEANGFGDF